MDVVVFSKPPEGAQRVSCAPCCGCRSEFNAVTSFRFIHVFSRFVFTVFLAGLPASSLAQLQQVQNAAARLLLGLRAHDHVTAALRELHWLPVKYRIQYKLCLLMHSISTLNSAMPGLSQSTSSACRQLNLSSRTEVVEQSVLCSPKNSNETG